MAYRAHESSDWVNVKLYGAVGSGFVNDQAVAASGQAIVTAPTGTFAASSVGATVMLSGGGTNGADLWTTIASYQNSGQVTLATNVITNVDNLVLSLTSVAASVG